MKRRIMVTLDSGAFFLPPPPGGPLEIGYFSCNPDSSDFQVYADGRLVDPPSYKLNGCFVADTPSATQANTARQDLISPSQQLRTRDPIQIKFEQIGSKAALNLTPSFLENLLHMADLYNGGEAVPLFERDRFESILCFTSGEFHPGLVKQKLFKKIPRNGGHSDGSKMTVRPIASDIHVYFDLEDGDELRVTSSGEQELLWSSKAINYDKWNFINLQLIADCPSAYKFYRDAVNHDGEHCWVPNPDPPPAAAP